MWTEVTLPFHFQCQLRHLEAFEIKEAVIACNKCGCFKDTNVESDDYPTFGSNFSQ